MSSNIGIIPANISGHPTYAGNLLDRPPSSLDGELLPNARGSDLYIDTGTQVGVIERCLESTRQLFAKRFFLKKNLAGAPLCHLREKRYYKNKVQLDL
jgi:hypothetical protein